MKKSRCSIFIHTTFHAHTPEKSVKTPGFQSALRIVDAPASGVPVWKIKKTAARKAPQELQALATYAFEKMEIAR